MLTVQKKILITGSTDGIGFVTAKKLVSLGHHVLIHGRTPSKLEEVEKVLSDLPGEGRVESYVADLSNMSDVEALAKEVAKQHKHLDVLINNAGVLKAPKPKTKEGFDLRFVVNTFAPYLLTKRLLNLLNPQGRIINLSSAAQAPVQASALLGQNDLTDLEAYAQSKLAITMWSRNLALSLKNGPLVVAVNPGSLLASKMVKEGFGVDGKNINIGADILVSLSLDDEHKDASGKYYDNDAGHFADPHEDALDDQKSKEVVQMIEKVLTEDFQSAL